MHQAQIASQMHKITFLCQTGRPGEKVKYGQPLIDTDQYSSIYPYHSGYFHVQYSLLYSSPIFVLHQLQNVLKE